MNKIFILDFGSGNTCRNDNAIIDDMIEQLADVDPKRHCTIKWQLFKEAGKNIPLDKWAFEYAYYKAVERGFKTTASVFDEDSIRLLLQFDIPFVKFANNPATWPLMGLIPRGLPVVMSGDRTVMLRFDLNDMLFHPETFLCCVSEYPAGVSDYNDSFPWQNLQDGISDHTVDWQLFKEYEPCVYECHYKLPDSTGLDAGPFARTPAMLREVLSAI